jgi:hypothetical protein
MIRHKFLEFFGLYISIASAIIGLLAYLPASNKLKKYFYPKKDDGTIDNKKKSIIYVGVLGTITLCGYLAYLNLPPIHVIPNPIISNSRYTPLLDTSTTSIEKSKLMLLTMADNEFDQALSARISQAIKYYLKNREIIFSPLISKNCFNKILDENLSCILNEKQMQAVEYVILVIYDRSYKNSLNHLVSVDGQFTLCIADLSEKKIKSYNKVMIFDGGETQDVAQRNADMQLIDSAKNAILAELK